MKKCFLLRASLLLSLLCVCARVFVELQGLCPVRLQKQNPDLRHQRPVTTATAGPAEAPPTCCRPLKHHRRVYKSHFYEVFHDCKNPDWLTARILPESFSSL